jgi:hypothetical protein
MGLPKKAVKLGAIRHHHENDLKLTEFNDPEF